MEQIKIQEETHTLIELARVYPYLSMVFLRKVIKQFDGDRNSIFQYIEQCNKGNNRSPKAGPNSRLSGSYRHCGTSVCQSIPQSNAVNPYFPAPSRFLSPLSQQQYQYQWPDRRRHVSAPQNPTNRILVLPPQLSSTKSVESCLSVTTNNDLDLLTPDSLIDVKIDFRKKTKDQSYDVQFNRLWKSISREMDDGEASTKFQQEQEFMQAQKVALASLQQIVSDMLDRHEKLSVIQKELCAMREKGVPLTL